MGIDELYKKEFGIVAGVDEAGRGCLAGPVVAAAVVLEKEIEGINDSKQLSPAKRERLFDEIMGKAAVGIGIASPEEIDLHNIFNATKIAMNRALENLPVKPSFVLVDGKGIELNVAGTCLVKGDQKSKLIGAASIVAKVFRDRLMSEFHRMYPQFSFHKHKGYATKEHLNEIRKNGVLPIHRMSFEPVLELLTDDLLREFFEKGLISKNRFEHIKNLLGARKSVVFWKERTDHNLSLF